MNTVAMEESRTEPVGVDPEVTAYVGLVRTALADLAPEDLEDLTGGLEADLAELAAESEEPLISRLGEPSTYAAELRSAAGFPPAAAVLAPETKEPLLRRQAASLREAWASARSEHPWLEQLRPVWWVFRGAVLAYVLLLFLGVGSPNLLGLVIGAGLSFWVGLIQDRWVGWRRTAVVAANVAAALMVLPALVAVADARRPVYPEGYVEVAPSEGTWINGEPAGNFYVYDGQGQRVDGARIFDQNGAALTVNPWDFYDGTGPQPSSEAVSSFPAGPDSRDGWEPVEGQGWQPPILIGPAPGFLAPDATTENPDVEGTPPPSSTVPADDEATDEPTGAQTGEVQEPEPTSTDAPTDAATTPAPTATP